MKDLLVVMLISVPLALQSCYSRDRSHSTDNAHSHSQSSMRSHQGHSHGSPESVVFTLFSDTYELFVEFLPLIESQEVVFTAHVTQLEDYQPAEGGSFTVELKGEVVQSSKPVEANIPGVFLPKVVPHKEGKHSLVFTYSENGVSDSFIIDDIKVYKSEDEVFHDSEGDSQHAHGGITFSKEQAWQMEFGVTEVKQGIFPGIIRVSGEILPVQGDEVVVTSYHSGSIIMGDKQILPGRAISAEEQLMSLSAQIVSDNLEQDYLEAKAEYNKATKNFEQAKKLVKDKLITRTEYRETEAKYQSAKAAYDNISQFYSLEGAKVVSPVSGYVKECLVSEGEHVEAGQALVVITKNRRLILRADVPQENYGQLPDIFSANFITPYSRCMAIEEYGGKKLSYGKTASSKGYFIPLYFEIDNIGKLIPGSYAEVFLKTGGFDSSLYIPISSIMEEQGVFYVFVQESGETYNKRYVTTGVNDGLNIRILNGLKVGERVVSKGAYSVKLTSISNTAPVHSH